MFENGQYNTVKAGTVFHNMRNGLSPSTTGEFHEKVLTLSAVTQGEFDSDAWKDGTFDECPPADKRIKTSEFYMCRGNGNKALVGQGVFSSEDRSDLVFPDTVISAQIDKEKVLISFLFNAWKQESVRLQIESAARTTNGTYKINQSIISNIEFVLPPLEAQKEFEQFTEQADKSKYGDALQGFFRVQKSIFHLS